jgi:Glycosyl transferase family 11
MIGFIEGYYGWLANQLFQFAATRALAHRRGVRCVFPRNKPDLHKTFMLDADPLDGPYGPGIRLYPEAHFHYDPKVMELPDNTVLAGYFQSERYFADCADLIRRELTFRDLHTSEPAPGTVSIHVRRGDYCKLRDHHPPLGLDYYSRAMARWPAGTPFMVFSDDPDWCEQHMGGWPAVRVMEKRSAAADMDLMSRCSGHVIANSSFSWWAAWLHDAPGKRVLAPLAWFGPAKPLPQWDTRDLIPARWERI